MNQRNDDIPANFEDLWGSDRDKQHAAYTDLLETTTEPVDWAGDVWDDVVGHLADDDNHNRSIAAQLLANLAVSVPDRVLDDFDELTAVTRDDRFVTARHALQALWRIGTIGPDHREVLIDFLRTRFEDAADDKNTTLIRADIIEALARLHAAEPLASTATLAEDLIAAEPDEKYRAKYTRIWRRESSGD